MLLQGQDELFNICTFARKKIGQNLVSLFKKFANQRNKINFTNKLFMNFFFVFLTKYETYEVSKSVEHPHLCTIVRLNSDKIIMFRILMNKRKRLSRKYFLAHFLQLLVSFLQLTTRHMYLLRIFLLLLLTTSFLLEACSSYLEHFRHTFKMEKSVSLTD